MKNVLVILTLIFLCYSCTDTISEEEIMNKDDQIELREGIQLSNVPDFNDGICSFSDFHHFTINTDGHSVKLIFTAYMWRSPHGIRSITEKET